MQTRVRRDSVVAELAVEDEGCRDEFKANTLLNFFFELALCGMVFYMIDSGPQPSQVTGYLTELLYLTGPAALVKLVLFYCTVGTRSLNSSEGGKVIFMLL